MAAPQCPYVCRNGGCVLMKILRICFASSAWNAQILTANLHTHTPSGMCRIMSQTVYSKPYSNYVYDCFDNNLHFSNGWIFFEWATLCCVMAYAREKRAACRHAAQHLNLSYGNVWNMIATATIGARLPEPATGVCVACDRPQDIMCHASDKCSPVRLRSLESFYTR